MNLRLPDNLRSEFKAPFGTLYKGKGAECINSMQESLQSAPKVVAVGDMTAFYLLSSSTRKPDLCVVDNKTKRGPIPDPIQKEINDSDEYEIIKVDNPAAILTQELSDIIRDILASDRRVKIIVRGEEDLATLPAILYAPLGSAVVYGQPDEGSVMVKTTLEKREIVKSIMDKMVVED
ncbi:MAG: GTP-dependent dephospho-CoA kinase family protein [Methanotrichaceae archaeon]